MNRLEELRNLIAVIDGCTRTACHEEPDYCCPYARNPDCVGSLMTSAATEITALYDNQTDPHWQTATNTAHWLKSCAIENNSTCETCPFAKECVSGLLQAAARLLRVKANEMELNEGGNDHG